MEDLIILCSRHGKVAFFEKIRFTEIKWKFSKCQIDRIDRIKRIDPIDPPDLTLRKKPLDPIDPIDPALRKNLEKEINRPWACLSPPSDFF